MPFCFVSIPDVVSLGPGLWKFNVSILEEEVYVGLFTNFWKDWQHQKHRFPSLAKWWEAGKSGIKGLSIRFCSLRSSAFSVKRDILSKLASHLKEKVDAGFLSLFQTYQSVSCQWADLDKEIARGAQVRARARWVEEGQSSSAFFFFAWRRNVERIAGFWR